MSDQNRPKQETIKLSAMSQAFIESLDIQETKSEPLEGQQYSVSETVSFFGFVYEKMRNAVEFNEEHLIRRLAISRILRRRLAVNPSGKDEGENLVRELLWGRYVPADELSQHDVVLFQRTIDAYILLFMHVKNLNKSKPISDLSEIVFDLMSTEIEESINEEYTAKRAAELYFFYQILVNKVALDEVDQTTRDTYFFVAAEQALAKNDAAFIMYHLFSLRFGELHKASKEDIKKTAEGFAAYVEESHAILKNPYNDKLTKFAKKQTAPFRILYSILEQNKEEAQQLVTSSKLLQAEVEKVCEEKYLQTGMKLRNAAIRSITYIFLTKMIFVLIFEVPLAQLIYGEIELMSIGINTIFPPLLMGIIVSFISAPSSKNTQRIYSRIVDILDRDPSFETKPVHFSKNTRSRRPILLIAFSLIYLLVFFLVFGSIYIVLEALGFNLISKGIFMFFISVVAFFAYRIRQTAKEYVLDMESNIFVSLATFIFLPILYVGKFLSSTVAKVNIFIIFFDYLIEAPFKFLIEIIEEWSRFLKARKDELV